VREHKKMYIDRSTYTYSYLFMRINTVFVFFFFVLGICKIIPPEYGKFFFFPIKIFTQFYLNNYRNRKGLENVSSIYNYSIMLYGPI
jgi:hypothetical protein